LGCVLIQEQQDNSLIPIGFWSRACNKSEKNYLPTEREALAIIWAVKMLRPYLERVILSVRTDHASLRWIFGATAGQENPRLVRWRIALAEHDFSVSYRPGKIHSAPDEMSRIQTFGMKTSEIEDEIPVLVISDSNDPLPTPTTPCKSAWQVSHLDPHDSRSLPKIFLPSRFFWVSQLYYTKLVLDICVSRLHSLRSSMSILSSPSLEARAGPYNSVTDVSSE
jgi:RNase H-like domain found in reverse transcriptase